MRFLRFYLLLFILPLFLSCEKDGENEICTLGPVPPVDSSMYFPPPAHGTWANCPPDSLNWNLGKLDELIAYLDTKNTKGFIILKDGKIVVEEYFDGHTINANLPWYSAAKSLTSTFAGIAADEGLLDLDAKTSDYLGNNWSNAPQDKQDLITVKNHLTMTTGFENKISNLTQWTCILPLCMNYEFDAGTNWAYHQGAFTLTQNIISNATGTDFKQYGREKVQNKIGMNGTWSNLLTVRVFSSTTRTMARFGLLALNKGMWNNDTIYSRAYYDEMTATSQNMNKAYGYLWWLNGKQDFLAPGLQTPISGFLVPNAPSDMFCALGAQDQKIYVIPSEGLVVVRSGGTAGNVQLANSTFDNELWGKINEVIP